MCYVFCQLRIKSCRSHCDVDHKADAKDNIIRPMGSRMCSECEAHMLDSVDEFFDGGGHDLLDVDGVQQKQVVLN